MQIHSILMLKTKFRIFDLYRLPTDRVIWRHIFTTKNGLKFPILQQRYNKIQFYELNPRKKIQLFTKGPISTLYVVFKEEDLAGELLSLEQINEHLCR